MSTANSVTNRPSVRLVIKATDRVRNDELNAYHNHLTIANYQYLETSPYQNDWMSTVHISPKALIAFDSKYKLDALVIAKALQVGDIVYHEASNGTEKSALFRSIGKVGEGIQKNKKLPTFNLMINGRLAGRITNCSGPLTIIEAFNKLKPYDKISMREGWKETLQVRRNGQEMGSLGDMRQALHYYKMLMAGWKAYKAENSV